jgi:CIC family chloride channel protein
LPPAPPAPASPAPVPPIPQEEDDDELELLASVVSYSVFISIFGESTLFAHAPRYPFVPAHLPLYALLAVVLALVAVVFLGVMDTAKRLFKRIPGPVWVRPGLGGLLLGLFIAPVLWYVGSRLGNPGHGLGLLGGGYGAAQRGDHRRQLVARRLACRGARARGREVVASSLTIGSGGSAGDFAPSLVIGGLLGGAFGRAAALLLGDPRIDPGAFALVGWDVLRRCRPRARQLAGHGVRARSYDLLVPLMVAEGVAFIALRRRSGEDEPHEARSGDQRPHEQEHRSGSAHHERNGIELNRRGRCHRSLNRRAGYRPCGRRDRH